MTDEEIVNLGDYCASLKSHDFFTTLVSQFEKNIVTHMLLTEPHETKKREGIYASFLGVRDFLGNMDAIIDEAIQIRKRDEKAPSEDAPMIEEDID